MKRPILLMVVTVIILYSFVNAALRVYFGDLGFWMWLSVFNLIVGSVACERLLTSIKMDLERPHITLIVRCCDDEELAENESDVDELEDLMKEFKKD